MTRNLRWRRGAALALVIAVATAFSSQGAQAAECSTSNPTACDWTDYESLYFASGPISYADTIGTCSYHYDIYISQKKATTLGISSCDQSGVRIRYSAEPGWTGWTSWAWAETTATRTVSGYPTRGNHRIDPWEV